MVNFKWVAFSFASGFAIAFVVGLFLRHTTTTPKIVSDERKSEIAIPVETPSNEIQTGSDIAMVNVLETIMNGTYETESESLAMEAVTHFIASIISNQTDPISKRNMLDVLSVIIRKERAKFFSSLGKTDQLKILMLIKSRMEDEAYATTAVDETVLQGTKVFTLLISYS
jgi:hypothetical protein